MILNERWGGRGVIVVHGEIVDARTLPALIAGEQKGLATYQIRQTNHNVFAELITLDAITAKQGVGTALIEALITTLRAEGVGSLRVRQPTTISTLCGFTSAEAFELRPCALARLTRRVVQSHRFLRSASTVSPSMTRLSSNDRSEVCGNWKRL